MSATKWLKEFLKEVKGYEELVSRMRKEGKTDEEIKEFLESFA